MPTVFTLASTAAAWTAAIATTLAVVVALFKDSIFEWLRRPKIRADCKPHIPFVVSVPFQRPVEVSSGGTGIVLCDAYWFRALITNAGLMSAHNLEAFAERLERFSNTGEFQPVETFIPSSLKWAGLDDSILPRLSRGAQRYLIVLTVLDPEDRDSMLPNKAIRDIYNRLNENGPVTELGVCRPDTTYSHAIGPGQYRLLIAISGDNLDTARFRLEFTALSSWPGSVEEFAQSASLKVIG